MNAWETEPDSKDWEARGLSCHILRHHRLKHLCGYVGIPAHHPLFRQHYDTSVVLDTIENVHGGLTYAEPHKPGQEDDGLWWFGFDCAHSGDLSPGMLEYVTPLREREVYRDMEYVTRETEALAKQLAEWVPLL